jgi:hypothetical protein
MLSLCYKYELKTFILFIMFLIAWKICGTNMFSGFHSILPKDYILLRYDNVRFSKQFLAFEPMKGSHLQRWKCPRRTAQMWKMLPPHCLEVSGTIDLVPWHHILLLTGSVILLQFSPILTTALFLLWQLTVRSYWLFKVQQSF